MKDIYVRTFVITTSSIVVSGILWLAAYSLNHTPGIGFDGPAGGVLGMTLFAGWVVGAGVSLVANRPFSHYKAMDTLLIVLVTGLLVCFVMGLLVSEYTMMRYPDVDAPL